MKKNNLFKLSFSLLLFALIFGLCACNKDEEPRGYIENQRVKIIEAKLEYTEADIAEAKEKFTSTATLLTKSYLDISLNNKQKQSVSERFDTTVVPLIYDVKIYKNELFEILNELGKYAESEDAKNNAKPLLLSVYEISLYVLGSERSGKVAYEIALEMLKDKIDTASERFENYGHEFYKTDFNRCSLLYNDIVTLGEEKFAEALSMSSIVISTLSAIGNDVSENAFLLTDAETLFILDKQGESLSAHCLSYEEWQIFGGLISEFIPTKSSDLNSATLYALKNYTYALTDGTEVPDGYYKNSYFASAMQVMPEIIDLFKNISKALKEDGTFSLSDSREEKNIALSKALSKCEESLTRLDTALNSYAKLGENDLKMPISTRSDPEALAKFMNDYSKIDCDDLIDTMNKIKSGEDVSNNALADLCVSYVFGLSPYLSFVLWSNVQ